MVLEEGGKVRVIGVEIVVGSRGVEGIARIEDVKAD